MKRSISIFFAAITLSVLPSCQLITVPLSILQHVAGIPIDALESLGGATGVTDLLGGGATGVADLIPLTDEIPQPELPLEVDSKEEVGITE